MLKTLIDAVLESYTSPRKGFRRVLNVITTFEAVAIVYALSFCVQAILLIVLGQFGAADGTGAGISAIFVSLFFSVISFVFITFVVFWVGRALGGTGSLLACATAIAWHSLVTLIFAPIISFAMLSDPETASGPLVLAQLVAMLAVLWLMASFVAEAHGFQSTLRVALSMIALIFLIGSVLSFLLLGTISAA